MPTLREKTRFQEAVLRLVGRRCSLGSFWNFIYECGCPLTELACDATPGLRAKFCVNAREAGIRVVRDTVCGVYGLTTEQFFRFIGAWDAYDIRHRVATTPVAVHASEEDLRIALEVVG